MHSFFVLVVLQMVKHRFSPLFCVLLILTSILWCPACVPVISCWLSTHLLQCSLLPSAQSSIPPTALSSLFLSDRVDRVDKYWCSKSNFRNLPPTREEYNTVLAVIVRFYIRSLGLIHLITHPADSYTCDPRTPNYSSASWILTVMPNRIFWNSTTIAQL